MIQSVPPSGAELLRPVRTQFLPGVARGHAAAGSSLMGLGNEGAICGRPAHDHWMNSPSSGQHTPLFACDDCTFSPGGAMRFFSEDKL